MATKFKTGDIVMANECMARLHKQFPCWYPAPGTCGTILNADDVSTISVQWSKGSTSGDDAWFATYNDLRKVTKRDISLFVKYYDKYTQTVTTSVKQYYKRPSKAKRAIEEQLLHQMNILNGYDYKVLGSNSHHFIAAFMVGKILHVHTLSHTIRIDTIFAKIMSDKRKERIEELERLVNDAMASYMEND